MMDLLRMYESLSRQQIEQKFRERVQRGLISEGWKHFELQRVMRRFVLQPTVTGRLYSGTPQQSQAPKSGYTHKWLALDYSDLELRAMANSYAADHSTSFFKEQFMTNPTKRNKLLTPEPVDTKRATGRTTAIALDAISRAIKNDGISIYAGDHHAGEAGARSLMAEISKVIARMGLKHFTVRRVVPGLTVEPSDRGYVPNTVVVKQSIWE